MDTITQGQATILPMLPAYWEPLERLKLKSVTVMKQTLLLMKTKLHGLLCFCRVAREHWLLLLIFFFKASELLTKTSYSMRNRSNEAWFPTALCPLSLNFFSQCNVPSLSQKPGSPSHISLLLGRPRGSRSDSWVTTINLFIGWLGATNSG